MDVEATNEPAASFFGSPKRFSFSLIPSSFLTFLFVCFCFTLQKGEAFSCFVYFNLSFLCFKRVFKFVFAFLFISQEIPDSQFDRLPKLLCDSVQDLCFWVIGYLVELKFMLVNMGLIRRLEWVNGYSKKQCRILFRKVRAAVKRAVKNGDKKQFNFQYDPSSYALNFDDGCCHLGRGGFGIKQAKFQDCNDTVIWVYVLWVES